MSQNEPRYHAAFMELARNSHIRPLRSRTGFGWGLGLIALVAFSAGLYSYLQFQRSQPGFAVHAPASVPAVVEVYTEEEATPDAIERWQNKLNGRAGSAESQKQ